MTNPSCTGHFDEPARLLTKLSVLIPAKDEKETIKETLLNTKRLLNDAKIEHELIVVNDNSSDGTGHVLDRLARTIPELVVTDNSGPSGFGNAIRFGLAHVKGDAVVIMMADNSDCAEDLLVYWNTLNSGWDCVFGSRFIRGGGTHDYPLGKLFLNRLCNKLIQFLFSLECNDVTNAFKAYRTEVIRNSSPYVSRNFNFTVELPLNAVLSGYSWTVVPTRWRNRKMGKSKLKLWRMGSQYVMTIVYMWLKMRLMGRPRRSVEIQQ